MPQRRHLLYLHKHKNFHTKKDTVNKIKTNDTLGDRFITYVRDRGLKTTKIEFL